MCCLKILTVCNVCVVNVLDFYPGPHEKSCGKGSGHNCQHSWMSMRMCMSLLQGNRGEEVLCACAESDLKTEEPPLGNTVLLQTCDPCTDSHALSCQ